MTSIQNVLDSSVMRVSSGLGRSWRGIAVGFLILATPLTAVDATAGPAYRWLEPEQSNGKTLRDVIAPPAGFERVAAQNPKSWASWLRGLPMRPPGTPVRLFTGQNKWRQDVHSAVINIDVGTRDLQQCADAIMRLRAEWLFARTGNTRITFNNTNGKAMVFRHGRSTSYRKFRKYMTRVFAYAGTYSLERELKRKDIQDIKIGDVFIKGGFPGHAVLVIDMAVNPNTGAKKFLLMQSFMPAQDMHILKNPADPNGGPWYDVVPGARLKTPEWEFDTDALHTWPSGS